MTACQYLIQAQQLRRPANALNIEATVHVDRCALRSPDGRGLRWLMSGGEAIASGACTPNECSGGIAQVSKSETGSPDA